MDKINKNNKSNKSNKTKKNICSYPDFRCDCSDCIDESEYEFVNLPKIIIQDIIITKSK